MGYMACRRSGGSNPLLILVGIALLFGSIFTLKESVRIWRAPEDANDRWEGIFKRPIERKYRGWFAASAFTFGAGMFGLGGISMPVSCVRVISKNWLPQPLTHIADIALAPSIALLMASVLIPSLLPPVKRS